MNGLPWTFTYIYSCRESGGMCPNQDRVKPAPAAADFGGMTHSRHVMPIEQAPPPAQSYLPHHLLTIVIIHTLSIQFHHEVFRYPDSLCAAGQCLCGGSQAQAQQAPSGGDSGKEPTRYPNMSGPGDV